ncbi:MAG: hypothetical protein CMM25_02890 [Rhodospirillaceae bacterium]|nr:hypothetical protein [Rhodospirillaceae bacterium]|tara:strand:+ start:201 stop:893 length:693 start_codon:yes stop_codon:yes gene_type:complete
MSAQVTQTDMKVRTRTSIILDVETTGIPVRSGWDYPDPKVNTMAYDLSRIVQIAWIIKTEGKEDPDYSHQQIVKPDKFIIPQVTVAIHGIDTARATREGITMEDTMVLLRDSIIKHTPTHLVAHNLKFDKNIILAEIFRLNPTTFHCRDLFYNCFKNLKEVCTMETGRSFAQIPLPSNPKKYKAPKLGELYQALTGNPMREMHDALYDTQKCAECYHLMRERVKKTSGRE